MTSLTPELSDFGHFVGTLEGLETNDQFLNGSGAQAFDALRLAFTLFREARDKGYITDDDEWAKIENLASDRATAYRVAKEDNGRMAVLHQLGILGKVPSSSDADLLELWFDSQLEIVKQRADAPLYLSDLSYAKSNLVKAARRREARPWLIGGGTLCASLGSWIILRRMKIAAVKREESK